MIDPYLGEMDTFGFDFAPRGWAKCDGQLLPINQNQSLYSLLGTTYGGDGRTTFALPDLRGRTSLGILGGSNSFQIGNKGGQETHVLTVPEMALHNHPAVGSGNDADQTSPKSSLLATTENLNYHATPNTGMHPGTIGITGGNQGHDNMQPYLVINWCICTQGLFPPRS